MFKLLHSTVMLCYGVILRVWHCHTLSYVMTLLNWWQFVHCSCNLPCFCLESEVAQTALYVPTQPAKSLTSNYHGYIYLISLDIDNIYQGHSCISHKNDNPIQQIFHFRAYAALLRLLKLPYLSC